jgi:hypothetical protein
VKRVLCFYEDDPGEQVRNFGPHALALETVADRTRQERWSLQQRVEGIPKKGISKLLKAVSLEQPHAQLAVLALVDEDRIRTELGLPPTEEQAVVQSALESRAPGVRFVLLIKNVDDLVRAAAVAAGRAAPTGKPTPRERDRILNQAASAGPGVRAQIASALPSWDTWLKAVEAAL